MSAVAVQSASSDVPATMDEKVAPIEAGSTSTAPRSTTTTADNAEIAPVNATAAPTTTTTSDAAKEYKTAEDQAGNVKTTAYASPDPTCHSVEAPVLTPEQSAKYDELLGLCKEIVEVPNTKADPKSKGPLTESERMFMTKECLLRYLRATKWIVADAKKRIEGTITWRREWGLESHTAEYIEPENETGKQVIFGFDKDARPCLYLNPARQNTERSIRQLQHLTFMLELVLDLTPPGTESLALLIDFNAASSGQNASVGQGKMTMDILQNHYPERLGRALVVNIPWWANLFLKAIQPFIDPVTRAKLKFNESMTSHVPSSHLLKEFNGDIDFTYTHSEYWPNLIKLCAERRQKYVERWRANGSQIGESEFYLKGGEKSKPLQTPQESVEKLAEGVENVTV